MRDTLRSLSASLATFLAPGLLLLLLGIQMAFGLRGFDRPDGALLYVLQVPGILLGWGAVAALLPLLVWMILDWWGYDLNGFALRGLGSAVLGIAVGTMAGLSGGQVAGGIVGGGLGSILSSTVGTTVSIIVLLLMAIPGGVLAFSMQQAAQPAPAPRGEDAPKARKRAPARKGWTGMLSRVLTVLTPGGYGAPEGDENAWYPEQRFDDAGREVPMDLGPARDVGGIRLADEPDKPDKPDEPTETAESEAPMDAGPIAQETGQTAGQGGRPADSMSEERLPTIPELLAGGFDVAPSPYEEDPSGGTLEPGEETSTEGPIHVGGDGRPVTEPSAPRPLTPPPQPEAPSQDAPPQDAPPQDAPPQDAPPQDAPPQDRAAAAAEVQAPSAGAPEMEEADAGKAGSGFTGIFSFASPEASAPPDDDEEAPLAPGVRYAPLPPTATEAEDAQKAGSKEKTDAKPEDDDTPPSLSASIERAVRGPTPPERDPSHSAAVRSIRTNLRRSVAALQNEGPSERHLAKLDAIGMFDAFEAPPSGDPSTGATQHAGAAAIPKRATKRVAKRGTRVKKAAQKPLQKKSKQKQSTQKKAATRKTTVPRKTGRPSSRMSPPSPSAAARAKNTAAKKAAKTAAKKNALLEALRIERLDPLFRRAVEAGLEHGGISPVLLTRRLGLPFARATGLLERLVASGVLEARPYAGTNALTITAEEWASLG